MRQCPSVALSQCGSAAPQVRKGLTAAPRPIFPQPHFTSQSEAKLSPCKVKAATQVPFSREQARPARSWITVDLELPQPLYERKEMDLCHPFGPMQRPDAQGEPRLARNAWQSVQLTRLYSCSPQGVNIFSDVETHLLRTLRAVHLQVASRSACSRLLVSLRWPHVSRPPRSQGLHRDSSGPGKFSSELLPSSRSQSQSLRRAAHPVKRYDQH